VPKHLEKRAVPRALLTRNNQLAVDHLVQLTGTSFAAMLTRDFSPVKPSPVPLRYLCDHVLVRVSAQVAPDA